MGLGAYGVRGTDVRRGTSGTSVDAPIFVHFLKKAQNSYTLVVKKPKFVHFGGKKTKIRTLVVGDAPPSPAAVHSWLFLIQLPQLIILLAMNSKEIKKKRFIKKKRKRP